MEISAILWALRLEKDFCVFYILNTHSCTETDAMTSPVQLVPKLKTTTDIMWDADDHPLVLNQSEQQLQQVRGEMRELQAAIDQLRADCDRRMNSLQEELDEEKTSRLQLVAEVERLKKIVATKLRHF